ncbi:MAG: DnaJ domain-containing protein [Myxococcota bacterium]|nr:DnaJ domain-containing protein [Myxococcota bacterium]MDW8360957.1 DnaJ domain-containing protein [Myxococcales bacterium]
MAPERLVEMPFGPREGWIASRIDGLASVDEIAALAGVELAEVRRVVDLLVERGICEWAPPTPPPPRSSAPPEDRASRPSTVVPRSIGTRPPPPGTSRTLYDPAELEEDCDVEPERRRTILDLFYRLDELDHYQLLGVPPDADRGRIRQAYFALSKIVHPDTLFGKRLGSYKAKMEAVFRRITEAYEVLGNRRKREEYDAYLSARRSVLVGGAASVATPERTGLVHREAHRRQFDDTAAPILASGGADDALSHGGAPPRQPAAPTDLETPAATPETSPSLPSLESASPPGSTIRSDLATAPAGGATPPHPDARPSPSSTRDSAVQTRAREVAARRLAAALGRPPPTAPQPRPSAPAATQSPETNRRDLAKELVSALAEAAALTASSRVQSQLEAARRAEAEGNLVAAVNAARMAVALAPDREEVRAEHGRLRQRLAEAQADTYERMARYEEQSRRYAEAAVSWSRVAEGRPGDPMPLLRAAECLLEARGDLQRARDLALQAAQMRPDDAAAHRTLGRIYVAAGMTASALRALETAARLDPDDGVVKTLLRELRR